MRNHDDNSMFAAGLTRLRQPILPLAGMAQFLYMTGDCTSWQDLLADLPEPIEIGDLIYAHPGTALLPYLEQLQPLVAVKQGQTLPIRVLNEDHAPLDALSTAMVWSSQQLLTQELEQINSLLCGPCGCQLCCIGPDAAMRQDYFEIPLSSEECEFFPSVQVDTAASRKAHLEDEPGLLVDGQIFYQHQTPLLIHWQQGLSLILPRGTRCPHLAANGSCHIYEQRPLVCRRPQIFPYLLEPEQHDGPPTFRLRRSLLAVMDCPYVASLQQEIAAYAAHCELAMVFRHNKT